MDKKAVFNEDMRYFFEWGLNNTPSSELEYNIHYDISRFKKYTNVENCKNQIKIVDLISYCIDQTNKNKKHRLVNIENEENIIFDNDTQLINFVKKIVKENGDSLKGVDVQKHIKYLEDNSEVYLYEFKNDLVIRIGTDSQFHSSKANYAVVVAFDFGENNGVHAIHKKIVEKIKGYTSTKKKKKRRRKKGRNLNTEAVKERLNRETYFSLAVAYFIRKYTGITCDIDLDYNSKHEWKGIEENGKNVKKLLPMHLSGEVVQENIGFCKSYGFNVRLKPETLIATPYADKLCRL